jgi:hypothetical protein
MGNAASELGFSSLSEVAARGVLRDSDAVEVSSQVLKAGLVQRKTWACGLGFEEVAAEGVS